MPTLASLSDAGGWAVFAFAVFWAGVGLVRKWWVPGFVYDELRERLRKSEARADKADTQATRNAEAIRGIIRYIRDDRRGADRDPR